MECALRCGQGYLEYNPLILSHKNYKEVEQLARIEMIRLFLKHPYERQPEGCSREAMALGSDCAIEDGYCFLNEKFPLKGPAYYHLPMGETYEYYAKKIQNENENHNQNDNENDNHNHNHNQNDNNKTTKQQNNQATKQNENGAKAELWQNDEVKRCQVNELIERTNDWGSIPGDIVERIKASTKAHINNSYIMQGFRSSVISSHRQLTRMKPNRRTRFLQMGNSRQFDTSLLVAVDVSGSISANQISDFYSTINRVFRFGSKSIDCVQFDSALGEVTPLKHTYNIIDVKGRGGTSYQPIFDYMETSGRDYDGLIILTDGQAPAPVVKENRSYKVLWACSSRQEYEANHKWMEKTGRVCYI